MILKHTAIYALGRGLPGVVNLAGYPLLIRAYEQDGAAAGLTELRQHLGRLLVVAAPIVSAFLVHPEWIARTFLGESFPAMAGRVLPLLSVACLLIGVNAFFFLQAFHLRQQSARVLAALMIGVATYAVLLPHLAPVYGVVGIAIANVGGSVALAIASIVGLPRHWRSSMFSVELPLPLVLAVGLFFGVEYLLQSASSRASATPAAMIMLSLALYLWALYGINFLGARDYAHRMLGRAMPKGSGR